MGKFDDFYREFEENNPDYKEFEDIYSDSRARDAAERYSRQTYPQPPSGGRERRPADTRDAYRGTQRGYGAYDRGGHGVRPDARNSADGYRTAPRNRAPYSGSFDRPGSGAPRPAPVRKKLLRTRRARRMMIVSVIALGFIVLLSGIVAIAVSSSGPAGVTSLTTSEIGAHQIALTWKEVSGADGYRVKMAVGDSKDYQDFQTVTGAENTAVTVSELDQASLYSFSVTSYKGDKENGHPAELTAVRTLPDTPAITNSYSAKTGTIHVDWTPNDKATGYVVEYKKDGGSYSPDTSLTVSDPSQCRADITDLDVSATYTVRVYAYVSADKQLNSTPSAETAVTVTAEDTDVIPKAMELQLSEGVDPDKPMIARTFDDGPAMNGDSSERILDVLEQYNAKATFFMVGYYASRDPDNIKRKQSLGMELGNHTWDHTHYGDTVTADDIRRASSEIYDICGQYPTAFRSPGGMTTQTILNECETEGMSAYYWSIDTKDWDTRNADSVYHEVMDHVQDGDIILMHEIYGSTADAVERMVPELLAQGYQLVTCHDLIKCKTGSDPVPGTQYVDADRTLAP